jgi:hypothetical protein
MTAFVVDRAGAQPARARSLLLRLQGPSFPGAEFFDGKESAMRTLTKALALVALCASLTLATGCMGLSLFSSEHVHHYDTEEIEQRLDSLEQRVDALEQQQSQR